MKFGRTLTRSLALLGMVACILAVAFSPAWADVTTAKAGTSGVTKGLIVKFSSQGVIATASAATDAVVGVCEQTAAASALTKYSGPGSVAVVTSGEAVTAGQQVQAGTGGKAFKFQKIATPPARVVGIAITTVAAADLDLQVYILPGAGADAGAINPYQIDATALYALGARFADPVDGRVYRYASCGTGGWTPGYGAAIKSALAIGENVHAAASIGDTTVVIEEASIAANAWAGGYIVLGHGSGATTQNRRVVSNTASATSTNHVTVTLDGALTADLTTGSYCEIIPCIYSGLELSGSAQSYVSFAGIPAAVATSGQYGWVQTWGPCWVVPGGGDASPGDSVNDRSVFFVGDGSVNGGTAVTIETGYQLCGFIIQKDSAGVSGPPFVMLQISP